MLPFAKHYFDINFIFTSIFKSIKYWNFFEESILIYICPHIYLFQCSLFFLNFHVFIKDDFSFWCFLQYTLANNKFCCFLISEKYFCFSLTKEYFHYYVCYLHSFSTLTLSPVSSIHYFLAFILSIEKSVVILTVVLLKVHVFFSLDTIKVFSAFDF